METLPIELLEHILRHCTGGSLARMGRVSTKCRTAVQNIERLNEDFWRQCCYSEINNSLLEDMNTNHKLFVHQLDDKKCKQIYIKWFSGSYWPKNSSLVTCSEEYSNGSNGYEDITCLAVTGNTVITGHRSGKVVLRPECEAPVVVAQHMGQVRDMSAVNMVGLEKYELKGKAFTSHHHIISVGEDSRIYVSLISMDSRLSFEINSCIKRDFIKVCVSKDLFAVSCRGRVDITLFRMILPEMDVIPRDKPLLVRKVETITSGLLFECLNPCLGLFTFSDLKLNCFCQNFLSIASSDVKSQLDQLDQLGKGEHFRYRWDVIEEVDYRIKELQWEDISLRIIKGFSFGNGIFFLITNLNQTLYSLDSKTFLLCPLEHHLRVYDKITSIALYGSVLACGTHDGYVYIYDCPSLERLHYLTHFKPIKELKLSFHPILNIIVTDYGFGPTLLATTKHKVYCFH